MTKFELPFACDLEALPVAQRSTHEDLLGTLQRECLDVVEEDEAMVLRYPARPELLRMAGEWIGLERMCCGFLSFELKAVAGDDGFTIRIGDGAEVMEFVQANFSAPVGGGD
jgi:hypothetical protein